MTRCARPPKRNRSATLTQTRAFGLRCCAGCKVQARAGGPRLGGWGEYLNTVRSGSPLRSNVCCGPTIASMAACGRGARPPAPNFQHNRQREQVDDW